MSDRFSKRSHAACAVPSTRRSTGFSTVPMSWETRAKMATRRSRAYFLDEEIPPGLPSQVRYQRCFCVKHYTRTVLLVPFRELAPWLDGRYLMFVTNKWDPPGSRRHAPPLDILPDREECEQTNHKGCNIEHNSKHVRCAQRDAVERPFTGEHERR